MNQDQLFALKALAWVPTSAGGLYASRFSTTPRWDMWFWGIAFWVDIGIFAYAVTKLAMGAR